MHKLRNFFLSLLMLTSCSKYYDGPVSDHFDGKKFFDPEKENKKNFLDLFKWRFGSDRPGAWPKSVPVQKYDQPPVRVLGDELRVSNVGHVTFLIQTQGLNILTDPVWSERASPVSFAGPKRVIAPGIKFSDLPPIDLVWISHNHYDHLDMPSLERLWQEHRPRIITPLGNDKIIHSYNQQIKVEAYDWGQMLEISNNVKLHLSPMQHWSARGLFDRNKALWAALTIETSGGNIYFIGDSGYGEGRYFRRDREKFGQFRLTLLPMGAYRPRWFMNYAHMDPEEMVKAHHDLGAPYTIPSHYDVFPLANEAYGEAEKDLSLLKDNQVSAIHVMKIGQYATIPKIANSATPMKEGANLAMNISEKDTYQKILKFWFEEIDPVKWWQKDSKFDSLIAQKFGDLYQLAIEGKLFSWRNTAEGALAEIIILDQFSRNIFRGSKDAFAQDSLALKLAQEAIERGFVQELSVKYLPFLYLPYMHSEDKIMQAESVKLFSAPGLETYYQYAIQHQEIIDRFGRYPHRNQLLGRVSTKEEEEFLRQPGSSF